jgi:hypothetical protein
MADPRNHLFSGARLRVEIAKRRVRERARWLEREA